MDSIKNFVEQNSKMITIVLVTIVVLSVFYTVYTNYEFLENVVVPAITEAVDPAPLLAPVAVAVAEEPVPQAALIKPFRVDNQMYGGSAPVSGATNIITPTDLLPKSVDANNFNTQFPQGSSDLSSKNFLTAGFNVGINTTTSSKKNANLQLRSDPYIPVQQVGPWNQSTVTPDLTRRTFELGSNTC